jgi:hypothetical protein
MHTLCPLLDKLDKPSCTQISKTLQQITTTEPTHYIQISPIDTFSRPERKITESKVWPRSMTAKYFLVHFSSNFNCYRGHDTEIVHISKNTPVPTPQEQTSDLTRNQL